jgi:rhamnosyltransferase
VTAPSASLVIPTLNARRYLPELFAALARQEPAPPAEVILVESGSRDGTVEHVAGMAGVRVVPIARFTHGGSRNVGVRESRGEFVAFLSQDALPADGRWLAELLAPFADPDVAATFSRQTPRPDASPMERHFLETHFPPGEPVVMRHRGSGEPLFQRDVFFSNVSAAVRRADALRFPFDEKIIMSEDQQLARDLLLAGRAVVYAPASVVLHSHNYSLRQAFERYFDSVYSLTQIFPRHDMGRSVSLGVGYLRREAAMMVRRHPAHLPHYAGYVLAKSLGTLLGHYAERMPRSWARRMSMHKSWWDRPAGGGGAAGIS